MPRRCEPSPLARSNRAQAVERLRKALAQLEDDTLLSPERREAFAAEVRADYAKISAAHFRAQADKKRLKLADARANAVTIDFAKAPPKKPLFLGINEPQYSNMQRLDLRLLDGSNLFGKIGRTLERFAKIVHGLDGLVVAIYEQGVLAWR